VEELAHTSTPATEDSSKKSEPTGKPAVATDMHIKVYSPFHTYFDEQATSISALNDTGPFDILPGHRNFMTLVSACELTIRTPSGGEQKIKIARAVMHVKADEVRVFLDV
jgi:F0F1-type ATP synthase epsilon subunit